MRRNIITGIDAGSSTIKIIVEEQTGNNTFRILGSSQRLSRGIRSGYIANFEECAEDIGLAIREAEKIAGVPIKHAYVAIGGISLGSVKSKGTVMVSRPDGKVTEYDVKRVISQSEANLPHNTNKHIIHTFPINFKLDGSVVLGRPLNMNGNKLEVETLFVTCLNQHLSDLVKAVEANGVAVDDVIASPLAASHSALTKHQKEVGCILTNLGASTLSMMVFEESIPISVEVFPIGSTHITNDIALGLQIPIEDAEKLKIDFGSDVPISKRRLSDIVEARLNDIFELIESHLKKINRNGLLPAGIILTGGGSGLVSLEEIAKASLRLPARIGLPFRTQNHDNIKISGASKEQILSNPEWSVALGLCASGSKHESRESSSSSIFSKLGSIIKNLFRAFLP